MWTVSSEIGGGNIATDRHERSRESEVAVMKQK